MVTPGLVIGEISALRGAPPPVPSDQPLSFRRTHATVRPRPGVAAGTGRRHDGARTANGAVRGGFMLAFGEVQTGLLQNSTALSRQRTQQVLDVLVGEPVRRSE